MSALFSALFRFAMLLVCGLIGILMCSAFVFFSNQRNWMFVAILLLAIKKPHSSNCYEDNQ